MSTTKKDIQGAVKALNLYIAEKDESIHVVVTMYDKDGKVLDEETTIVPIDKIGEELEKFMLERMAKQSA